MVDLTPFRKIVEEKSDDNLTKLGHKSENDKSIAPQKSARDKNSTKAVKDII